MSVWLFVTGVTPSAKYTVPRVGKPVTVIVNTSPSTSTGAAIANGVATDSSATTNEWSLAMGASCDPMTQMVIVLGVT